MHKVKLSIHKIFVFVTTLCLTTVFANAANVHGGERVHEPEKLSNQAHFNSHNQHNAVYDHDAFLGADEARKFEHLSPEESRKRLGKIVDKIDTNRDGFVSEAELLEEIKHHQNRYAYKDADRLWKAQNTNKDSVLTWTEYNETAYGGQTEEQLLKIETQDFKKKIRRDRNRWDMADQDRDRNLSYEEFAAFLHPEAFIHMQDVVAEETLEDMDDDKDGFVSLEEYIDDLWAREGPNAPEPEWVPREREYFMVSRDRDGDGKLNAGELREWIFPSNHDPAEAEMKHLLYEADKNKDGKLTKTEIVDKFDLFAGSQATDFGDAIKAHDEF